jgi:hypothetical protein
MPIQPSQSRHDLPWWREAVRLRRHILSLKAQTQLLRRDLAAKRYNPNQPRVPAGNSDGGQWSSGASGGGSAPGIDLSGLFGDLVSGLGAAVTPSPVVADVGGTESWASYQESTRADGSLAERAVVNRDGSTIHSEYAAPGKASDWDERHTVTLPDGSKTTFETRDRTQTIRAGGPDGEVVSKTTWTERGPEPEATVQLARGPLRRGAEEAVNAAGSVLFGWLSARDDIDGQRTVMGFLPRDYRPGPRGQQTPPLTFIGRVTQEELKDVCRRLEDVQKYADQAARDAGPINQFPSMQTYGTDVHVRFKRFIDAEKNPLFRAERSFLKEGADPTDKEEIDYGYPGSIRTDAYEFRIIDGTLCVYDLKAGKRGVSVKRSDILATAAYLGMRNVQRVIMLEVRPRN